MASAITTANEKNFQHVVLEADRLVLIAFTTSWAGPGKALMQTLEKFAPDKAALVKTVVVDVDECPNLAEAYNIRSVPTLVTMKGSQAIHGLVGDQPYAVLEKLLAESMAASVGLPVGSIGEPAIDTGKRITVMHPVKFGVKRKPLFLRSIFS